MITLRSLIKKFLESRVVVIVSFCDEDFGILQKSMNDLYNYNLSLSNNCYEEILYAKYL